MAGLTQVAADRMGYGFEGTRTAAIVTATAETSRRGLTVIKGRYQA